MSYKNQTKIALAASTPRVASPQEHWRPVRSQKNKLYKKSIQVHSTNHLLLLLVNLQGCSQMLCNSIHKITASCGPASIKNSAWKRGACHTVVPIPLKFICSIHNMQIFKKHIDIDIHDHIITYLSLMELIYKSDALFVRTFLSGLPCRWSLSTTALRRRLPNLHLLAQLQQFWGPKCGYPGIQMYSVF